VTTAAALGAQILPPRQRWRGIDTVAFLLRIGVSVALFAAVLWLSPQKLAWHDLASMGIGTVAACFVLSAGVVLLLAWRWRYLVSTTTRTIRLPSLAAFAGLTWTGLAVNQLLPSVIGGDALRATLLTRRGVPAAVAAGSVIVDRLYGFAGLSILCVAGAPLLSPTMFDPVMLGAALVGLVLLVAVLSAWAASQWSDRLRSISQTLTNSLSWRRSPILMSAAIGGHLANTAIFLVIAHALGASLQILPAIAVLSAVLLVSALPISIAGWGLREFALVQAFGGSALEHDKVVLSSVAYGLFLLLTQAAGFLMILRSKRT